MSLKTARANLLLAVRTGNVAAIRFCVAQGVSLADKDPQGFAILHIASARDNALVIAALVSLGCDVNKLSSRGDRLAPLHISAANGNTKAISTLVSHGARVDVLDSKSRTPLMAALEGGFWAAAGALVRAGADVNCKDRLGRTPLYIAVMRNDCISVKMLAENKADIHALCTEHKLSLVRVAALHGHWAVIEELARLGAHLTSAAMFDAISSRSSNSIGVLARLGVDVNASYGAGFVAVHAVVARPHCPVSAQLLLTTLRQLGADFNKQDANGETALLHYCSGVTDMKVVRSLLAGGAKCNIADKVLTGFCW